MASYLGIDPGLRHLGAVRFGDELPGMVSETIDLSRFEQDDVGRIGALRVILQDGWFISESSGGGNVLVIEGGIVPFKGGGVVYQAVRLGEIRGAVIMQAVELGWDVVILKPCKWKVRALRPGMGNCDPLEALQYFRNERYQFTYPPKLDKGKRAPERRQKAIDLWCVDQACALGLLIASRRVPEELLRRGIRTEEEQP